VPIIRASCSTCGDVDVAPSEMRILVCSTTGESAYSFSCPVCRLIVRRTVEKRIVEVLVAAGVRMHFWKLPDELLEERLGPPIDYDDILNFHYDLAAQDWVKELQGTD
jgi:hypothetical protein